MNALLNGKQQAFIRLDSRPATEIPNQTASNARIQMRYEMAQAKRLLDLAAKLCLEATSDIEKAIGIERGS